MEVTNRDLKRILEKLVACARKDWSIKLDGVLGSYRIAYKIPLGTTPYRLVNGKVCLFTVELEQKAYWALKLLNYDLNLASEKRKM